jgi:hypothetical protein
MCVFRDSTATQNTTIQWTQSIKIFLQGILYEYIFWSNLPQKLDPRQALSNRTSIWLKLDHDQCTRNINKIGVPLTPIYNPLDYVTRQAMYVQPNVEACSCNHCCSGKAVSVTYWECVYRYPATNAHEPYCHLWPASFCYMYISNFIS